METQSLRNEIKHKLDNLGGTYGFYLKFLKTGEEIGINQNKQIVAASVIKILILCEFFRQVHEEGLNKNIKIKIKKENIVDGSGIIKLLGNNIEFPLIDLAVLMIVSSDNSTTNELIDQLSLDKIEENIKKLGLKNTNLKHKMMKHDGKGENFTTPYEIAQVLEKIYNKELPGSDEMIEILTKQQDKGRIPKMIPKEIKTANKTGSLEKSIHDVGIVFSNNPFVISFLTDNQGNRDEVKATISEISLDCYIKSKQL